MQSTISRGRESSSGAEKKGESINRQSTLADARRGQLFRDAAVIAVGFSTLVGGGIGAGAALGIIPKAAHKIEIHKETPTVTIPAAKTIYADRLQELGKLIRN